MKPRRATSPIEPPAMIANVSGVSMPSGVLTSAASSMSGDGGDVDPAAATLISGLDSTVKPLKQRSGGVFETSNGLGMLGRRASASDWAAIVTVRSTEAVCTVSETRLCATPAAEAKLLMISSRMSAV